MIIEVIIVTILVGVAFSRPAPFDWLYRVWSGALVLLWIVQAFGLLRLFTR